LIPAVRQSIFGCASSVGCIHRIIRHIIHFQALRCRSADDHEYIEQEAIAPYGAIVAEMEDQLVQALANTQSSAEGPRKQAELDLRHAQSNPAFPLSLANIGSHSSIALEIRQAALSSLRQFIERNWSGESDEGPTHPISDQVKEQVRSVVLEIALSSEEERKIKTAARYVEFDS
jgi:hypothetical protein